MATRHSKRGIHLSSQVVSMLGNAVTAGVLGASVSSLSYQAPTTRIAILSCFLLRPGEKSRCLWSQPPPPSIETE